MAASQREESEFDSSSSAKRLEEPSFAAKMKLQAQEVRESRRPVKTSCTSQRAGMAELADAADSKPTEGNLRGDRPPPGTNANTGSIWQGCQISPLFQEDAQDDQAIYLIILRGRGGWVSRCGGKAGLEAAAFRSLDVRTSRSAGLRWFALRDNLLRAGKFREARCDRPRWVDPKIAYRTGQGSHELLPMLSNPAFGLFLR